MDILVDGSRREGNSINETDREIVLGECDKLNRDCGWDEGAGKSRGKPQWKSKKIEKIRLKMDDKMKGKRSI